MTRVKSKSKSTPSVSVDFSGSILRTIDDTSEKNNEDWQTFRFESQSSLASMYGS